MAVGRRSARPSRFGRRLSRPLSLAWITARRETRPIFGVLGFRRAVADVTIVFANR
jgi:hypothetical protein